MIIIGGIIIAILILIAILIAKANVNEIKRERCGMRSVEEEDLCQYEELAKDQFLKELKEKNVVSTTNLNICDVLVKLHWKGYHYELVKDGKAEYNDFSGFYDGSHDWQKRWHRIVFDKDISPKQFCEAIRKIMKHHHYSETQNGLPHSDNHINGEIRISDSYSMFTALYAMRYSIKIENHYRDNEPLIIRKASEIDKINKLKISHSASRKIDFIRIGDVASIERGVEYHNTTFDRDKGTGILYPRNIVSGKCDVFNIDTVKDKVAVAGDIIIQMDDPFDMTIWQGKNALLSDEVFCIRCNGKDILQRYLYYVLRSIDFFELVKETKIKESDILNCMIPVGDLDFQHRIIESLNWHEYSEELEELDLQCEDIYIKRK